MFDINYFIEMLKYNIYIYIYLKTCVEGLKDTKIELINVYIPYG